MGAPARRGDDKARMVVDPGQHFAFASIRQEHPADDVELP